MLKIFGLKTLGRVRGRQQPKVGESSLGGRRSEVADPTTRPGTSSVAPQTVDLYSTTGPIGIKVIADPTNATFEYNPKSRCCDNHSNLSCVLNSLVFIHGLTGNRDKTWTHANGVFWPQELAKDIPTARIMTFGYDADVVKLWGTAGSNDLRNHGKSLAFAVSDRRRECRDRPIIFIAHSLGGLVCEQALLICGEGERNLEKVFQATRGIIFMGTPHGGADLANWGYTIAKYLNVIRKTNSAILGGLRQKSGVLTAVQQQFQQLLRKPGVDVGIYCFFEEKAVIGVGTIVSEQSAVLSQYPNQSIAANHMDMTKFSGRNDEGYQKVLSRVQDFVELMNPALATDISMRELLTGSGQRQPRVGNLEPASSVPERGAPPNQTISNTGSGTAIGIGNKSVQGNLHINLGSHPDHEKGNKCQQLLRTSEYERYKQRNQYPVKGTCQWFLGHNNYVTWRDSPTSSILWVSAYPGCGKSVLSRFLADKELKRTSNQTICYFFFKDDNEDQKTAIKALCALLHQLFTQKPELLSHAIEVYNQNGDEFVANVDLLWNILTTASADPKAGEIICVLDALDECRELELNYLLQKICAFYKGCPCFADKMALKILVTSRPLQRIADIFNDITQKLPGIRLAGEEDTDQIKREIDLVIEAELETLQQKRGLDLEAVSRLRQEFTKFEHRTYLWLKLVFELLRNNVDSPTKRGRQKIFGRIPDSIDAAYTAILNQSTDKEQAKKLLQIVCTASRPLSVTEMNIAISIQPEDKVLKDLETQSEEFSKNLITNLCGLFVSVIDGKVYLLHQTAKEFLIGEKEHPQSMVTSDWIWKHSLSVKDSNFVLAHICIWYLRLEGFPLEDQSSKLSETVANLISEFPFLEYAAMNWAIHFREATIPTDCTSIALALDMCNSQAYSYKTWSLVYWNTIGYTRPPTKLSSLHLASFFGHTAVVSQLLAVPGIEVNAAAEYGRTPLSWAAANGHAAVVSQLLAVPGIEVNAADKDGRTPLSWAAIKGDAAVVSQLLAVPGIEVNAANKDGSTPLSWAAERGHTAVVSQLLAVPGIEVNAANKDGWTPLSLAAINEDAAVVSQLLAVPGIEVNAADKDGWTPLSWAAINKDAAVVSQLLAVPGIEVNAADKHGLTPLSWAAYREHTAVVSQLLAVPGIEVNAADKDGRTPLSWAAANGHAAVVSQLLAVPGIEVNAADKDGSTPLSLAAINEDAAVVSQLLAVPGIEVNAANKDGSTPLSWAAERGHTAVVSQLLAVPGIEVNVANKDGWTPLSWAAANGDAAVVSQLLAVPGIEVNAADKDGQTPLSWAAINEDAAVVSQLLAVPGIEVNAADKHGLTPLSWAAEREHTAVVSQLLAVPGIEVNAADKDGQTPLSWAAERGHTAVVSQLLAVPGIEVNAADKDGQTPLSWAAERGHTAVVSQLLAVPGIEVNAADKHGLTPLSLAVYRGHAAAVKLLLATDSTKPDLTDRIRRTPLLYAAKNGTKAIIELLIATSQVNVDSKDFYDSTPLSIASRRGHKDVVAFLLTKSRSLNITNTFGQTPLWWARRNGYHDIANLLLEKYRESGIAPQEDDLPIATIPLLSDQNSAYCDVCVLDISDEDTYYYCKVCISGNFCICIECLATKAHCLDETHTLFEKEIE